MNLKEDINTLRKFCDQNKIPLFQGFIGDETNQVTWTESSNVSDFLELMAQLEVRCIAYYSSEFHIEKEFPDTPDLGSILGNKNPTLENLKSKEGDVQALTIQGISNNFAYIYFESDRHIQADLEELSLLIEESSQNSRKSKMYKLSEKKREQIAKDIASNFEFFATYTRPNELNTFCLKIIREHGYKKVDLGAADLWEIKKFSYTLYEEKFKLEHESYLKNKIAEFKINKLPKKEMVSRLGITKGMLDKFYY